jgi:hypothetical protein
MLLFLCVCAAKKPEIQQLKAPKKVTKGSSLTLRCKAKAKPNPVFTWSLNGQPLSEGKGLKIKHSK